MSRRVLSCRTDLPFYLRLQSARFFTWDPDRALALIYPQQRFGQVNFARSTAFSRVTQLLDSPAPAASGLDYRFLMTCSTIKYGELPTLKCDLSAHGGFEELRAYTEITVFLDVYGEEVEIETAMKMRAFQVLNNFLEIYKVMSQDPYVRQVNDDLDLYFVEYSLGIVPQELQTVSTHDLFEHLDRVRFPEGLGPTHEVKIRINTLEDLFPGDVLPQPWLTIFGDLARAPAPISLDCELILNAESELKRGNYHVAVLEAETAFEVYVVRKLEQILTASGQTRADILKDFEDPRRLGLLSQRLRKLDQAAGQVREQRGFPVLPPFVGSTAHDMWKRDLYDLRNKIIHEGQRPVTFDQAKGAIGAAKAGIHVLNNSLPIPGDFIQLDPSVEHLQRTAGRLSF